MGKGTWLQVESVVVVVPVLGAWHVANMVFCRKPAFCRSISLWQKAGLAFKEVPGHCRSGVMA